MTSTNHPVKTHVGPFVIQNTSLCALAESVVIYVILALWAFLRLGLERGFCRYLRDSRSLGMPGVGLGDGVSWAWLGEGILSLFP